jgi:hypothetical protein
MIEDYIYDGWGLCPEVFEEIIRILPEGSTILELGSGSGTRILSKKYNMVSIEDDPEFIGKYESRYIDVPLIKYNKEDFPFMWEFFYADQHWYDPRILRERITEAGNYDLILIDGPKGYRGGLLSHLDIFDLSKTIVIDDTHDNFHYKKAEVISEMTGRKIKNYESKHLTPNGVIKRFSII